MTNQQVSLGKDKYLDVADERVSNSTNFNYEKSPKVKDNLIESLTLQPVRSDPQFNESSPSSLKGNTPLLMINDLKKLRKSSEGDLKRDLQLTGFERMNTIGKKIRDEVYKDFNQSDTRLTIKNMDPNFSVISSDFELLSSVLELKPYSPIDMTTQQAWSRVAVRMLNSAKTELLPSQCEYRFQKFYYHLLGLKRVNESDLTSTLAESFIRALEEGHLPKPIIWTETEFKLGYDNNLEFDQNGKFLMEDIIALLTLILINNPFDLKLSEDDKIRKWCDIASLLRTTQKSRFTRQQCQYQAIKLIIDNKNNNLKLDNKILELLHEIKLRGMDKVLNKSLNHKTSDCTIEVNLNDQPNEIILDKSSKSPSLKSPSNSSKLTLPPISHFFNQSNNYAKPNILMDQNLAFYKRKEWTLADKTLNVDNNNQFNKNNNGNSNKTNHITHSAKFKSNLKSLDRLSSPNTHHHRPITSTHRHHHQPIKPNYHQPIKSDLLKPTHHKPIISSHYDFDNLTHSISPSRDQRSFYHLPKSDNGYREDNEPKSKSNITQHQPILSSSELERELEELREPIFRPIYGTFQDDSLDQPTIKSKITPKHPSQEDKLDLEIKDSQSDLSNQSITKLLNQVLNNNQIQQQKIEMLENKIDNLTKLIQSKFIMKKD